MATYKQVSTWTEDGGTPMTEIIVISDSYTGVNDLSAAEEIGFVDIESTHKSLDIATGIFAEDELSFTLVAAAVRDAADLACFDLVLSAQIVGTNVYVSRLINPADPDTPVPADFDFRGLVRPEQDGSDLFWNGDAYSSTPSPLRDWKCKAGTFGVTGLLGKPVKDLAEAIDPSWFTTNAVDRLGYFRSTGGDGYGYRQVKFANLVRFDVAIQALLDESESDGVTFTYEWETLALHGFPTHFSTFEPEGTRYLYGEGAIHRKDSYPITLGDSITGSVFVSSRLLKPINDDEEKVAWTRYETLAELLYDIAGALGLYVVFNYVSPTDVRVRFKGRETITGGTLLLRDAEEGDIAVKPAPGKEKDADKEKGTISGRPHAVWQHSMAPGHYRMDGQVETDFPFSGSNPLPITMAPALRFVKHGKDAGRDPTFGSGVAGGYALLPHNAVLWDEFARESEDDPVKNAAAMTTQLFMQFPASTYEQIGEDTVIWAPLCGVNGNLTGWWNEGFKSLADFHKLLVNADSAELELERNLTVPYINAFKAAELGDEDWRNVGLGAIYSEDARDYVLVDLERGQTDTKLKFHRLDRFAFSAPVVSVDETEMPPEGIVLAQPNDTSPETVRSSGLYEVGSEVTAGQVVALQSDGTVAPMVADHTFHGKLLGVVTQDGLIGELVRVQSTGRVYVPGLAAPLAPGARVFLRSNTLIVNAQNISETPLLASTAGEDLYLELGVAEAADVVALQPGAEFVLYPRIT
jgi:hypothetical protein